MEQLLKASLPFLANDLEFEVSKPTATDAYYTDGLATGSFLKLIVHSNKHMINVYLFPSGSYYATSMPQEIQSILDGWLETVRSKKIEQESHLSRLHK
jgi:hypothetical protein